MTDGYPPPANPPRSKGSGIRYLLYGLVVVGIVGPVVLIVLIAAAGVGFAGFMGTDDGQRFVEGVKQGYELAVEGTTAPGAQELREAGCQEAMVTTVSQLTSLVSVFVPEEEADEFQEMTNSQEVLLFCQSNVFSTPPSCSELARVYGEAVDPDPERVVVMVQKQGEAEPVCDGYYALDGTRLGGIDSETFGLEPEKPQDAVELGRLE